MYAVPRHVSNLDDCSFYHTMDIPGFGVVEGQWDLRHNEAIYLGNVDFRNKRVLEIGCASGFFTVYIEQHGAEVVCYDLSDDRGVWDVVPYVAAGYDCDAKILSFKRAARSLNNGFWLVHRSFDLKARVVYGSVYDIPDTIGQVDIATFGNVLLHVRDPFLALQRALRLTRETVIVTETIARRFLSPKFIRRFPLLREAARRARIPLRIYNKIGDASMMFAPDHRSLRSGTWWYLTPEIIKRFIGVLGFEKTATTYHIQKFRGIRGTPEPAEHVPQFTVVGRRSKPIRL